MPLVGTVNALRAMVGHRARGLVLDRSDLDRRIEAVTAVADAVDP